jgi:hypothetical protein
MSFLGNDLVWYDFTVLAHKDMSIKMELVMRMMRSSG